MITILSTTFEISHVFSVLTKHADNENLEKNKKSSQKKKMELQFFFTQFFFANSFSILRCNLAHSLTDNECISRGDSATAKWKPSGNQYSPLGGNQEEFNSSPLGGNNCSELIEFRDTFSRVYCMFHLANRKLPTILPQMRFGKVWILLLFSNIGHTITPNQSNWGASAYM